MKHCAKKKNKQETYSQNTEVARRLLYHHPRWSNAPAKMARATKGGGKKVWQKKNHH
jgi:hypothetical protein